MLVFGSLKSRKKITFTLSVISDMEKKCNVLFTIYILVWKFTPVFGTSRRAEDGPQTWKQHSKPERRDLSPDVTDRGRRYYNFWEDSCSRISEMEDYWDKQKYNRWKEIDYNGHQLNANVYFNTQSTRNDRQSWKIYACIITVAFFLFLVAFIVF